MTFGVAVSAVAADSVTLSDGSTVDTDTVIWAGGISGATLVDHDRPPARAEAAGSMSPPI